MPANCLESRCSLFVGAIGGVTGFDYDYDYGVVVSLVGWQCLCRRLGTRVGLRALLCSHLC